MSSETVHDIPEPVPGIRQEVFRHPAGCCIFPENLHPLRQVFFPHPVALPCFEVVGDGYPRIVDPEAIVQDRPQQPVIVGINPIAGIKPPGRFEYFPPGNH